MPIARADIAIFGGGVAGLWTRFALEYAGFSTVLLTTSDLGEGQTVHSQGILHSGVKYNAGATAALASAQLRDVQPVWNAALAGVAGPDLRRVRVLADRMYLWGQGAGARATARIARAKLRSEARRLRPSEFPPAFAAAPRGVCRGVGVVEVFERSVDPVALVEELAHAAGGPMIRCARAELSAVGETPVVRGSDSGGRPFEVSVARAVLCAGRGNAALLESVGVDPAPLCQLRPLHMLVAAGAPAELFAHCIQPYSDKPYLTITTAHRAGGRVWYIGGDIAETGVARTGEQQIEAGKEQLLLRLPWLETRSLRWSACRIDRAEGRMPGGTRPDGPVVLGLPAAIAAWPTKLALAPTMADMVLAELSTVTPTPGIGLTELQTLATPRAAAPPWSEPFS